jgi:hypothetical protein
MFEMVSRGHSLRNQRLQNDTIVCDFGTVLNYAVGHSKQAKQLRTISDCLLFSFVLRLPRLAAQLDTRPR